MTFEQGKLAEKEKTDTKNKFYDIVFASEEQAQKATQLLHGSEIENKCGKTICVNENMRSISNILRSVVEFDVVSVIPVDDN